jgi:hypothetical protein
MIGSIIAVWFALGIAGLTLASAIAKAEGETTDPAHIPLVFFGPFALLFAIIYCVLRTLEHKENK